jgi:GNAT superfamily N-acetyltransferase
VDVLDAFGVALRRFFPDDANIRAAADIYVGTWDRPVDETMAFIRFQSLYPDFVGYLGEAEDTPVGMGFGTRSQPGQWWHDRVAVRVGSDHPALQDAWVLTELAVLPPWRGFGIGGAIHDALLAAQPCPRVLLSTEVSNVRARRMYEKRGWTYLHPGFAFTPGQPAFCIMRREMLQESG